ncbi:serine/threonine-protein kinase [Paenibacillus sp. YPG26]|uniref:serine/threonine-protein kinase n=1 Tax=Paenibacillus sp. YPG26 TaxID=2878915 RepID=UPI0020426937|nr:serine/threonine-protein kinase [Paenibacillus sp. YPG26]USB31984.1 serine/threonine-protein kinase [Paenibacillus sp. YPG26]
MSFQPNPGDEIYISQTKYRVGQHPAAPGMAYAQAGRQGTVYKLIPEHGGENAAKALKIFYPKYRNPALVYQSERMEIFSSLPGLQVCSRLVITPETNGTLIAQYPEMLYAVLMPWVNGSTWMDVLAHREQLTLTESWEMAKGLAAVGSSMEQKGLAHCDLSSPNVLLPAWRSPNHKAVGSSSVELVDVEQLYSPRLDPPDIHFTGSPGYALGQPVHRSSGGPWHAYADRFSGAVILAEMLAWSDPRIVAEAWGESYFAPEEMQTNSARFELMTESLEANWGKSAAELFVRAWHSDDVRNCPTFGEWLVAISMLAPEGPKTVSSPEQVKSSPMIPNTSIEGHQDYEIPVFLSVHELVEWARKQEESGNKELALEGYRKALAESPEGGDLYTELSAAVQGLTAVQVLMPPSAAEPKVQPSTRADARQRKPWLYTGAALLILLIGSLAVYGMSDTSKSGNSVYTNQDEPVKQSAAAAPPKTTTPVRSTVQASAASKDQQIRQAKAEAAAKAAQLEEERKRQEAAQQKKDKLRAEAEAKKKAELERQQAAQVKYDRQLQYEKYLMWKQEREERLAREAAEQKKADAARKAKLEQQKRVNEQKARVLAARREQQVIKLNASFNQAYNAFKTGRNDTAKAYAWQFLDIYSQDSGYFSKKATLAKRAASLKKFLAKNSAGLPDI